MTPKRLEAFSDGVIAIIITIMVLELRTPTGADLTALRGVVPTLLGYVLSFAYLAIYWNNHHHLLHAAKQVNGRILWANMHLLFWLSLVPFVTGWMGEFASQPWPVALYGGVLLMAGTAYYLLTRALIAQHGNESCLAQAIGRDVKGKLSLVLYAVAIPAAFVHVAVSLLIYIIVALIWLRPDRRLET